MLSLAVNLQKEKINEKISDYKWSSEKYRKHWDLSKHCHKIYLAKSLPNTHLITNECKYFWQVYSAKRRHDKVFEKYKQYALSTTLVKKETRKNLHLKHLLFSEQLINLDKFFYLERKNFLQDTAIFIKEQPELEIVCFEGLGLTRKEGFQILSALESSQKTLKFLYLWRVYKRHEYSLPLEYYKLNIIENYDENKPRLLHNHHWLKAIKNIHYIQILSINYSYIASETGDILITLAKQLNIHWQQLQLLCLEDELPCSINLDGKINCLTIADDAWNEARKYAKRLKVQIVLLGIKEYHLHKRYLTQSIPLQSVVLATNIEILHHKPCFLDCTFKMMYIWYHRTLTELHLNLWNHREMLDNHLRKIFTCLPNLEKFYYLGFVRDAVTIFTMCCQIKVGVCAIKDINLKIQRPIQIKQEISWLSRLDCIIEPFKCDFFRKGVTFEATIYPY